MSKKDKQKAAQTEAENKELDESTEAAVKESAKAKDKDKETALRDALHIRRTAKEVKRIPICKGFFFIFFIIFSDASRTSIPTAILIP